jgi:hypothetical protein
MIKKIEIKKWSTHFSVKIWEKEDQALPRVRSASINRDGRSPHLARILAEEKALTEPVLITHL